MRLAKWLANHFLCPWVLHFLSAKLTIFCVHGCFIFYAARLTIFCVHAWVLHFLSARLKSQLVTWVFLRIESANSNFVYTKKKHLFISQHGNVTRRPRPPHFKKAPTTFQNQRPWNDKTALPRLRDKAPPPPAFQKKPRPRFLGQVF